MKEKPKPKKPAQVYTNYTADSDNIQNKDLVFEFELEHYKYILQEIRSLNDNLHKYLALFQTLGVAIVGGGISIFIGWRSLKIDAVVATSALQGLLGLLIILTLFLIISLVANMFAWFDYRNEEVELLEKFFKPNFRKSPTLSNFWRWSETYVLIFIIVIVAFVSIYVEIFVIPLVK